MRACYQRADATLFTSMIEHEAFGLVPLEAMVSGCSVIATCVGGSSEHCIDGVNCLRFTVIWRKECQGRKPHQTFLAMLVRGEKGLVRLWDLACYWSACPNEGTHESSIDLASFCLGEAGNGSTRTAFTEVLERVVTRDLHLDFYEAC